MDARTAKLTRFVEEFSTPGRLIMLEAFLASSGVLPVLEKAKTLPVVTSPNPHHPEGARQAHEAWWNENIEEREAYHETYLARTHGLMLIQLGTMLGDEIALWNQRFEQ